MHVGSLLGPKPRKGRRILAWDERFVEDELSEPQVGSNRYGALKERMTGIGIAIEIGFFGYR